ncbi:DUF3102 domain-containing protein [Aetokthonos hydrillicola Thurmond2011]|jgi:hypothetical protein|uniref:DUF3102 domain-containing protein n=1 Tax=Aetokthonos hydrillicola Thurmond2011 TaxID=2712845 RepID=A0AAP5M8Q1_9CYAN|nr:DUF3102 domain-containing protein [Aetokthonos hydrillicola]MBO3459004.1 DUF3102 domain-containing protein [Aetokthonos hydrillicola CCALA 1050]MBW4589112.1 DUF3102 domain-containing protein [Aetokthonos hydrillicola CCALA 1050]MDR9894932.1 DUF3102 domain-containing protein [Aetokthonos hydrillicola Thurmond2011]
MGSSKLLSKASDYQFTQPIVDFDYKNFDTETRIVIQQETKEIKSLMRTTIQAIVEIGQKLTHVKTRLGHGNFGNWLNVEFDWSLKTASRFMQVYENFKSDNLTDLNIAISALYLLASPSIGEEVRKEALKRASAGENITYTKAKTIIAEYTKGKNNKKNVLCAGCDAFEVDSEHGSNEVIYKFQNETYEKQDAQLELAKQLVHTQKHQHSSQDLVSNRDSFNNSTIRPVSAIYQATSSQETFDDLLDIETGIKKLTPEQLTLLITNSASNGLSYCQLSAIIIAAQQALNSLDKSA